MRKLVLLGLSLIIMGIAMFYSTQSIPVFLICICPGVFILGIEVVLWLKQIREKSKGGKAEWRMKR